MAALLEVDGLKAFYGQTQALHDVAFSLEDGGITTLLGANGAGKTTTLRAVCGMIRTTGTIEFEGRSIAGKSTESIVRLGIAHVPQGRGTFTRMNVEENLLLGAISRSDKAAIADDIEKMYAQFPVLKERRLQQAGLLSGGEQQMLAVARALMSRPRILLMDEPSLGLAPLIVEEIFRIVGELNKDGVTIFLVEQNVHMALKVAHHFYLMEQGRVTFSGEPGKLAEDEVIQRAYLGTSRQASSHKTG